MGDGFKECLVRTGNGSGTKLLCLQFGGALWFAHFLEDLGLAGIKVSLEFRVIVLNRVARGRRPGGGRVLKRGGA